MIKSLPKQFGIAFFLLLFMVPQSLIAQVNPAADDNAKRLIKQYEQGFLTNPTFAEKQIISEYMDRMQKPMRVSKSKEGILSPNAVTHFSEDFTIPVLNENFDYGGVGDPDLTNVTANWTRHSGSAGPEYLTTSLSYAGYPSSGGGSVGFDYTSVANGDVNRTFSAISGDTDVFVSFLVNLDSARTQDYFFHIAPDPMGFSFRGRVRARDNGAGWSLGLSKSSSGVVEDLTVLNFAQTYLVVLKYTISTATTTDDVVTLYVYDAGIPATEPGTPIVTIGPVGAGLSGDISNVGTVAIRQGTNTASGTIDGIRVSSSWAELFPTSTQPPTGWTNVDNGFSGTLWDFTNAGGRAPGGSFDADFATFDADLLGSGPHDASLTSSAIDLSTAGATVLLGFDQQFNNLGSANYAIIDISSDGVTWANIDSNNTDIGYPGTSVYTEYDISSYSGMSTVYVRWTFIGGWDWWWAIDNVVVYEPDVLPPLPAIVVNPLDAAIDVPASTTLDWMADGGGVAPTGYRIYFGTDGGGVTPPTTIENNTDLGLVTSYTPGSALAYSTTYYWQIVAYNVNGDAVGSPIWSFTTMADPLVTTFPFTETFEDASPSRLGWTQIQELGAGDWTYDVGSSGGSITTAFEGLLNARFVSQSGTNSPITKLVSPPMDLTSLSVPRVSFYYGQESWFGDQNILNVYYRISDLDPWVLLSSYVNDIAAWTQEILVLPTPSATYQIAFEGVNNWGRANVIDLVVVEEAPAGAPDPAVLVSPLDAAIDVSVAQTLNWTSGGGAPETGYLINFGTDNPPTNIELGTDLGLVTSYAPASLAYATTYYWEIIPYNGGGNAVGTAIWSFTTGADPTISTFPYAQDFENAGAIPAGWEQDLANTEDWLFGTFAGHGASSDHTTGSGYFAWIDDSSPSNANPSNLLTPPFDISALTNPTASLFYWIGDGWGGPSTLHIDVFDGSIWTNDVVVALTENASWANVSVDLTAYKSTGTKIRFRAIEDLSSFNTDICVDDFSIFDNVTPPNCALNVAPLDAAIDVSPTTDLNWSSGGGGPTGYKLFFGTDNPPTNIENGTDLGAVTAYTPASILAFGTTYYWQVVAYNANGDATGCAVWSFTTLNAEPLPFSENFEAGTTLPPGWSGNMNVTANHGTLGSNGLNRNLWSSVSTANASTPFIGAILATTQLEFDYRIVNWSGYPSTATTLTNLDNFNIRISTDGGATYTTEFTIDSSNHVTSTNFLKIIIPLGAYAGSTILVNWDLNWFAGDYYFDIDNVLLRDPPAGPPDPAVLVSPPDAGTDVAVATTLDWTSGGGTAETGYLINFGTDNPPTNIENGTDLGLVTSYAPATLSFSTTYYWEIIPYNGSGNATGTTIWSFTTHADPLVTSFPFTETFEDASTTRFGWTQIQEVGAGDWTYAAGSSGGSITSAFEGLLNARFVSSSPSGGGTPVTKLVSPPMDITSLSAPIVSFYYGQENWFGDQNILNVYYRISDLDPWVLLSSYINDVPAWTQETLVLPSASATYQIAFEGVNNWGRANVIDLVKVSDPPAVDLAFTDFYQSTGLPTPEGANFTTYQVEIDKHSIKTYTSLVRNVNGTMSTDANNTILVNSDSPEGIMLANVNVSGVVNNLGTNAASYDVNWDVGGTPQTLFTGPSVSPGASDTASLTYTPTALGTFLTSGSLVVVADENAANDNATPFRMRVYPDVFTRTIYDRGDNLVDTHIGWGVTTIRMKAGVRFTAAEDIQLAGVDYICRTETVTSDTFEVQVRVAGVDTLAPGDSVLYSQVYTASDYFALGGDYIFFQFDGSVPTIAAGSDYWITIKAPLGVSFPGGAHISGFVPGRSFYELTDSVTWSPLILTGTEYAWIMRSVQVAAGGGSTFSLTVSVLDGWNMVSIPGLHPTDQDVLTWWSGKDPAAAVFGFNGSYSAVTTAAPSEGYWMKHLGANVYDTGDEWPAINIVTHDPIPGNAGWNLIGGYENIATTSLITTNPPGLVTGPVFGFSGGYSAATILEPGQAYWIKLSGAGDIIIPSTLLGKSGAEPVEYFKEEWGRIIITDNAGRSFVLYAVSGNVNLDSYEMPPAPPEGSFDIRFSSNRIAEDINTAIQTIEMSSGVEYPIVVKVENMDIRVQDESGKMLNEIIKSGQQITINSQLSKLVVTGELVPEVYSLEQNYPNPFNPSTVIEFSLPENASNVRLTIYNALGERVAELVNTTLEAGKYSYQWDATNVATGMYIYELRTNNFVSVKKMMLLK